MGLWQKAPLDSKPESPFGPGAGAVLSVGGDAEGVGVVAGFVPVGVGGVAVGCGVSSAKHCHAQDPKSNVRFSIHCKQML